MKSVMKLVGVAAAIVLMAGSARAAEHLAAGRVKSIDAEKKTFVLTDGADKDWTIKLGDDVLINRDGKEGTSDLKAGDPVSVAYEKGITTWTARYILVKDGETKDCQLVMGKFKAFDADKKEFTVTDVDGKDWTYSTGEAKIRLNMQPSNIDKMRVGDTMLMIVHQTGDKTILQHVMAGRAK